MVEWAFLNTQKINRIGYNKEVESMFIDFVGSTTDAAYLKVPEPLFESFKNVKSPDKFYDHLVKGYFKVLNTE